MFLLLEAKELLLLLVNFHLRYKFYATSLMNLFHKYLLNYLGLGFSTRRDSKEFRNRDFFIFFASLVLIIL